MAVKIETYEEETRESLEAYQRDTLAMCRTKGWAHLLGLLEIRRKADSNILAVKDGDDLQKKKSIHNFVALSCGTSKSSYSRLNLLINSCFHDA